MHVGPSVSPDNGQDQVEGVCACVYLIVAMRVGYWRDIIISAFIVHSQDGQVSILGWSSWMGQDGLK